MKLLTTLFALLAITASAAAAGKRPNILFILVDDQSPFDLRVYDPKSPLQTPNIDKLAAGGMTLDGAYHMGSFNPNSEVAGVTHWILTTDYTDFTDFRMHQTGLENFPQPLHNPCKSV